MKYQFGLFEICYKQGNKLIKLTNLFSKDGETALKEARRIFKEKLQKVGLVELCYKSLPINRSALKVKDPA